MIARSHTEIFPAADAVREAGGDRPLLLEPGRVWLVLSGRMDVFATLLNEAGSTGGRTHLFRVECGAPLFGVGADPVTGTALLAVGAPGTRLAEIGLDELRALAASPRKHAAVAGLLHAWIERLYEGVAGPLPRGELRGIEPGEALDAGGGTRVRSTAHVGWVEQLTGTSCLLGRGAGELAPGELLPLSDRAWVEGGEGCTLRLIPTEYLLADEVEGGHDLVWSALERLHRIALALVAERVHEMEAARRERIHLRTEAGRAAMQTALGRLASTLPHPSAAAGPVRSAAVAPAGEDPLVAVFRQVAGAAGIPVEPAAGWEALRCRDPLDSLARACRVRTRRVALRDGWWRSDAGPMLGRTAEEGRPVALLPSARGGYEAHDPREPAPVPVTAETVGSLAPFASVLYRPFPAERVGLRQLLHFGLHGCRRDLLAVLGASLAAAALGLLPPLGIGMLFSTVIPGAERHQLLQLTLVLLVAALATAGFAAVRGTALLRIEARVGATLQAAVWDRLLSLPLPFFRGYAAGELAVRAMGIEEIRRTLSGAVVTALLGGAFSLGNFALLFHYDPALAALAAVMVAVALAVCVAVGWLQLRRQRAVLRLHSRTSGTVLQLLGGISKLRMAGAEVQAFGLWARLFSEQRREQLRARALGNWLGLFSAVCPVVCTLALFALSTRATGEPAMGTGAFLGFMAAFNICLAAALSSGTALIGALAAVPLYEQASPILHAEPEVHSGKHDPGELSGAVELQHVTFRYRADGPPVLRDVSLRVRPGEFVAFVGPSGSGKSTLLRLLLGFETPEAGSVSYDEQDLAGLDVQAVRRQLGTVLQDGTLLSGSIFDNIVGSVAASHDEAWEAARLAGLEEDVRKMPMGLHTHVSDGGGTFSGGQRQRLMIARALLNRPRILLLDEATSALDNRTQSVVAESLAGLKATRIVVAHRLSTVMGADRIYVVQGGRIVETGTYRELLERRGLFHEMAQRQLA
ncbi:MAG TPA: NHLP bacteriocin export ABC transporter permease/ATPase subunit [Longimicrobiaceae bacterium]|nr:NHLP bacteriocin export ABC transporter permease/ATPase subunit [Longimicrobiaceae bacterium]